MIGDHVHKPRRASQHRLDDGSWEAVCVYCKDRIVRFYLEPDDDRNGQWSNWVKPTESKRQL